jgi:hypothetical protein
MVVWGVDVVVGVVFPVFFVQNGTWCVVCGFCARAVLRLCFPIATYSIYMDMGGGDGRTPAACWGWCGLCVCELPHTSSVREVTGHPSRCVGGRCVCLHALSTCFLTSICLMYARMCDYGCGSG